jgi:hypothetical protein
VELGGIHMRADAESLHRAGRGGGEQDRVRR